MYNIKKLNPFYTESEYSNIFTNDLPEINDIMKENYIKTGKLINNQLLLKYTDIINKQLSEIRDYSDKKDIIINISKDDGSDNTVKINIDVDSSILDNYLFYVEWFDNYYQKLMDKKRLTLDEKITKSFHMENAKLDQLLRNKNVLSKLEDNIIVFTAEHIPTGKKLLFKRCIPIAFNMNVKYEDDEINIDEEIKEDIIPDLREGFIHMFFNNKKLPFQIPKCYGYIPCENIELNNNEISLCNSNKEIYLISEYIENEGTLSYYLKHNDMDYLAEDLGQLMYDIISNLNYLNKNYGFTHGDFSPNNILIIKDKNGLKPIFVDFFTSSIDINKIRDNFIYSEDNYSVSFISNSIFYDIVKLLMIIYDISYEKYDEEDNYINEYINDIFSYYDMKNTPSNYKIAKELYHLYENNPNFYLYVPYQLPEFYNYIDTLKSIDGLLDHIKNIL